MPPILPPQDSFLLLNRSKFVVSQPRLKSQARGPPAKPEVVASLIEEAAVGSARQEEQQLPSDKIRKVHESAGLARPAEPVLAPKQRLNL